MQSSKKRRVIHKKQANELKKSRYFAPKLVVHSGGDFIGKLGPAQACSPSPGF